MRSATVFVRTGYGPREALLRDVVPRLEAAGLDVEVVDGHDRPRFSPRRASRPPRPAPASAARGSPSRRAPGAARRAARPRSGWGWSGTPRP